jgi:class 3 adenylate cyclase/tetratricopeptide (TPR) repeat protein
MSLNHKVSFAVVCLFLMASLSGLSQNTKIDSLKGIIETGTKDTLMVNRLNELSTELLKDGKFSESFDYGVQANELATQLDFKKGKAKSLKNIGLAKFYQGELLEVLDYWTQSLEAYEVIHDTIGIANLVNNLGAVYYQQGSHPKALDFYLRSLSISEKIKDTFNIAQASLNLGGLYAEMQNYENALKFFYKIEEYRTSINNPDVTTSYLMGVGEVFFKQGLYEDALKYYEEALSSTQNITFRADNLIKLGEVHFKTGNETKAIDYLNQAYQTAKDNDQQSAVVQSLIALATVYKKNDLRKALISYKEAEILAKEIEANDELRDIYDGMSQSYAEIGDYSNAFKYQSLYLAQKDLIFNLETDDKIRGLQFDFDLQKKEDEIGLLEKEAQIQELTEKRQKNVIWGAGIFLFLVVLLAISLFRRYKFIKETNLIIENEKNRSESLLLNILPEETALELKEFGKVKAKRAEEVTVLFTDFVGFTAYAKNLEPEELVNSVDYYFSKFDLIMEKYNVEKIKTIGDAYMCASGLHNPDKYGVFRTVQVAFEMVAFIEESKKKQGEYETGFDVRIGLNTGPVVAGVVGTKKFAYDIWGDSVNVASRMESKSKAGKINISESTYELIKDVYECEYRGEIDVKNTGVMKLYFVNGIKDQSFLDKLQIKETVLVS